MQDRHRGATPQIGLICELNDVADIAFVSAQNGDYCTKPGKLKRVQNSSA